MSLINGTVLPIKLGGDEKYDNLELLHESCHKQHNYLLEKYGKVKI